MTFYAEIHEETWKDTMILSMRRTGPYGADNYILMNHFKNWLNAHDFYNDTTVILAMPLDNPQFVDAQKCRYDVGDCCTCWQTHQGQRNNKPTT